MLEIQNLSKVYPNGTRALDDVSFTVPDGQFLVIIGLSGSGKSTLLRCINRLIDPTSGRIIFDGQDVTSASQDQLRHIRRQIGMVFQQFNLVRRSTVMANVLAGRLDTLFKNHPALGTSTVLAGGAAGALVLGSVGGSVVIWHLISHHTHLVRACVCVYVCVCM